MITIKKQCETKPAKQKLELQSPHHLIHNKTVKRNITKNLLPTMGEFFIENIVVIIRRTKF